MAQANSKQKLKEMLKAVNDKYARGLIDDERQIVTLEVPAQVSAWKEGYVAFLKKHPDKHFPALDDINWVKGVKAAWPLIHSKLDNSRLASVIEYTPEVSIVFTEDKKNKSIYDSIKKFSIDFIQSQLENYKLTGRNEEIELNPGMNPMNAAKISDVGTIKAKNHRNHKGSTAIGGGRLALTMKWISKTRFWKGFSSSKQAKTLEDKYGKIFTSFTASGTKKRGLVLTPNENIKISMGIGDGRGGIEEDWSGPGGIKDAVEAAAQEWLKEKASVQGWKGSKSIEENAVDAATYTALTALISYPHVKIKGRKPKASTRKKSSVKASSKGKSPKTHKAAKVVTNPIKRTVGRSNRPTFSPLALVAAINKKLPQTVLKNMNAPGLESRTGRFAKSAEITDIMMTPQGFPSIGYTYQRNPYGVFEDGSGKAPWANGQRDPRKLIDRSIREIAAEFAIGRFYTRRQ